MVTRYLIRTDKRMSNIPNQVPLIPKTSILFFNHFEDICAVPFENKSKQYINSKWPIR